MNKATLLRGESTNEGTFGKLTAGSLVLFTLELPWRNDENNASCIPVGLYECRYTLSPRLKKFTYEVFGDKNRAGIRIHSANFVSQLLGCIALGEKLGVMDGKKALLVSRPAIATFERYLNYQPFLLEVK